MKPSRPVNKGHRKFINKVGANSSQYRKIATGDLLISHGIETAFIALPNTSFTVGAEFLKTRDMDGAINIAMSDHEGWIKGVALTRLENGGPLRLMPLSYQPYVRNIQILEQVAYGFHTEAITDTNDWYIKLIATDVIAGSASWPLIYVGLDSAVYPPGDIDGDGLDDEEQAIIEEGISSGNIPGTNPFPETQYNELPIQTNQNAQGPRNQNNNQPLTLELVLHEVQDAAGNTIDINERQIGATYPESLTFYLRTTANSVIADEVYYYVDVDTNSVASLVHPPAGPSGRVKQKMWVIEDVEVTGDGDFSFLFTAEAAGYDNSDVEVRISYGEEVIEEGGTEGDGTGTGEGTGTGDGTGTGGGTGGGSVTTPQVILITLDSTTDNSDNSEVTGTLSAPSTITFSGTLHETVTSVYSSTGDAVIDNGDRTWTMTKDFTTDGVQSITFYATDGTETQSVVGSVTLQSEASDAYVQPSSAPETAPVDGGTIETNLEDPEALDVVGTSYVLENLSITNPLVTIAIKIKLTQETPVFTFSNDNGSITVSATKVTASGRLFDSRHPVLFEDPNANFLNGEWLHLVMVFDKKWSGGYSGVGNFWRSYGAINGVTFEKVLEVINHEWSFASRTNLFNDGTLTVGPGDFTFKHLEIIPGFAATPDQITDFWNADATGGTGYLYKSVVTVAAGTTIEPIYETNLIQIDSAEYQNSAGIIEFDSGILTSGGGRKYKNGKAFEFFKMSPLYQNGKTWAAGLWIDTTNTSTAWQTIFAKHASGGTTADGWFVRAKRDSNGLYQFSLFVTKNNASSKNYITAPIDIGDGYVSLLMKLKWELSDNLEVFVNDFSTPVFTTTVDKDYIARSQTFDFTDWPLGTFTMAHNDGPALFTVGENFFNAANGKERLQGAISYLKGFHGVTDAGMDQQIYAEIQASIGEIVFPQVSINDDGLTNQENYTLTGTFLDCVSIAVNGVPATLNGDGTWSIGLTLVHGTNSFEIIAIGPTGISETISFALEADLISPIILLAKASGQNAINGDIIEIVQGEVYPYPTSDDGVSVVNSSAALDSSILGDQTITYTCQDDAGNSAIPLTVTYRVVTWQPQHLEDGEKNGNNWSVGQNSVDAIGNLWVPAGGTRLSTFNNSDVYRYASRQTVYVWFKVEQPASNTGIIRLAGSAREGTLSNSGWSLKINRGGGVPVTGNQVIEYVFRNGDNQKARFEIKDSLGSTIDPSDGKWHNIIISYSYDGVGEVKCWFDGVPQNKDTTDPGHIIAEPTGVWITNINSINSIFVGAQSNNTSNLTDNYGIDALTITNDLIDDAEAVARYNAYKPHEITSINDGSIIKDSSLFVVGDQIISDSAAFKGFDGQTVSITVEPTEILERGFYSVTFSDSFQKQINVNFTSDFIEENFYYVEGSTELFLNENNELVNDSTNTSTLSMSFDEAVPRTRYNTRNQVVGFSTWFKWLDPNSRQNFQLFTTNNQSARLNVKTNNGNNILTLNNYYNSYGDNNVEMQLSFSESATGINLYDGEWHHIYLTFYNQGFGDYVSGDSFMIIVDGVYESRLFTAQSHIQSEDGGRIINSSNNVNFSTVTIGQVGKGMIIDSYEITNGEDLTAEQIKWIYDNGNGRGVRKIKDAIQQQTSDSDTTQLTTKTSLLTNALTNFNQTTLPFRITADQIAMDPSFYWPTTYGFDEKCFSFWAISNGNGTILDLRADRYTDKTVMSRLLLESVNVNGVDNLRLTLKSYMQNTSNSSTYGQTSTLSQIDPLIELTHNSVHHYAIVVNKNGPVKVYVDGVLSAQGSFATNEIIFPSKRHIFLKPTATTHMYDLEILLDDDFSTEIANIAATQPTGFDEPSTISLYDQDGNEIVENSITIYQGDPLFAITPLANGVNVSLVTNSLDNSVSGLQTITYQATNPFGISTTRSIDVNVVANDGTLFGDLYHRSMLGVDVNSSNVNSISYLNQILTFDGTGFLSDKRTNYLYNNTFSFSFWFKFEGDEGVDYGLFSMNGWHTEESGLMTSISNTQISVDTYFFDTITHVFASDIRDGAWHNFVYTYDNKTFKVYLDGTEVGTEVSDGLWGPKSTGLTIGAKRRNNGQIHGSRFIGQLSNGFIYNSVLSPQVISDIHALGLAGDATPIQISSITLNGQDALDYSTPISVSIGDDLSGLIVETNKETFTIDATSIDTSTDLLPGFYSVIVTDSLGFTDSRDVYIEVGNPVYNGLEDLQPITFYGNADSGLGYVNLATTSDYALKPHEDLYDFSQSKTISFWFRTTALTTANQTNHVFVAKWNRAPGPGWFLGGGKCTIDAANSVTTQINNWINSGSWYGFFRPIVANINSQPNIDWSTFFKINKNVEDGQWHHVVYQIDDVAIGTQSISRMFLDGVQLTESFSSYNNGNAIVHQDVNTGWQTNRYHPEFSLPSIPLQIGQLDSAGDNAALNGALDGINIENGVIDEATILSRYNAGR